MMNSTVPYTMFLIIATFTMFLGEASILSRAPSTPFLDGDDDVERCHLDNIPVHQGFDHARFQGKWYLVSDYNVGGQVVSNFLDIDDVWAEFEAQQSGAMKIRTGARLTAKMFSFHLPFMSMCFEGDGSGRVVDDTEPAKLAISYKTYFSSSLPNWERPYWLIHTDYNSALFYSCFRENIDGSCDPQWTFAWTLHRERTGHTHEQQQSLSTAARTACLDPQAFRQMDTTQRCGI